MQPRVYLSAFLAALAVPSAIGMFRFDCHNVLVRDRTDPIVNLGEKSSHLHIVSGGNKFSMNTQGDDLMQSTCTSCPIGDDLSAYWVPALYVKLKNGTGYGLVDSNQIVYYQQRGEKDEKIHAFPPGLKMLAGDPALRTGSDTIEQRAVTWVCLDYDNGSSETPEIPNKKCPNGLRGQVNFPMCWNGKDLDSPDHKSHVAYATGLDGGKCPTGFKKIIKIFYEMFYHVERWEDEWDGDKHPFVLSTGDDTGYGFHGDFFSGWKEDVLQAAADECVGNIFNVAECAPLAPSFTNKPPEKRCTLEPEVQEEIQYVTSLPGSGGMQHSMSPTTQKPEVKNPEVQEPEVQEPEVQEPEVQEPEVQEPEVQEPTSQSPTTESEVISQPTGDSNDDDTPGTVQEYTEPPATTITPSSSPTVEPLDLPSNPDPPVIHPTTVPKPSCRGR